MERGSKKEVIVLRCATNERGRAEEEQAHIRRQHPDWNPVIREVQGRSAWTETEAEAIAEMTFLWQRTMLDFANKGWLRLEPPLKFTSVGPENLPGQDEKYKSGIDDKGLPYIATVTMEGLEEAERRIRNDPLYSKGAFSSIEAFTGEKRAAVVQRNPWAAQKWQQEDGAGT
jgi:hypothetical protein